MSALSILLDAYRSASASEREKGTYFEELICCYLRHEASYRDLYSDVWTYAQWAELQGLDQRDTGIDLVARTRGTDELHAIQCKPYAQTYRVGKSDIDSFSTASGKKAFSHRIIITTDTGIGSVWAAITGQIGFLSRCCGKAASIRSHATSPLYFCNGTA